MEGYKEILELINKQKLKEAESLLLEKKERDGQFYYLLGLVSFFKGNEEDALGFFSHALKKGIVDSSKRSFSYVLFSRGRYEKAKEILESIENKRVEDYFVLFSCYLMLKDYEKAKLNLEKAYIEDKKKTKELLMKFYKAFFEDSSLATEEEKERLKSLISSLKENN